MSKNIVLKGNILGFDFEKHVEEIQHMFTNRIMKKIISQSAPENLKRKSIIHKPEDYDQKQGLKKSQEYIRRQMDKLQGWLRNNICQKKLVTNYSNYLIAKKNRQQRKVQSIGQLILKIADKIRKQRVMELKQDFIRYKQKNRRILPSDQQLEIAVGRHAQLNQNFSSMRYKMELEHDKLQIQLSRTIFY